MPIQHIVVLMLENRSFDHMLGLRPGVNGLLGPDGRIDPRFKNLLDPANPASKSYAVTPDAPYVVDPEDVYTSGGSTYGGPSHSLPAATEQLFGDRNGPVRNPAPMSGFLKSYYDVLVHSAHRSNPSDDEIRLPMQVFGRDRLPVLWTLADEFVVCDNWFSEVPGPTEPNRLFVHAATSTGFAHNVWGHDIQARTIYEELERVKKDWSIFYFDLKDSDAFPQLKGRVDRILQFQSFYDQAKAGTLPAYSFLCPRYNDAPEGRASDQHAPDDVRYGEMLIADVYEALRAGPAWNDTLLIVTYDEHGGFYDHVAPGPATPPDAYVSPTEADKEQAAKGTRDRYLLDPDYQFGFDRLGMRVPTLLVSPLVARGAVDSTLYQHTSILATMRDLFGTRPLNARDGSANSFAKQLTGPVRDTPAQLPRPTFTDAENHETAMQSDLRRPVNGSQREMWPVLAHLDGHPDSGKVTAPPPTRAAAAAYVKERIAAHERYHEGNRRRAPPPAAKRPGASKPAKSASGRGAPRASARRKPGK